MATAATRRYWLDVFRGWAEAREMPGPQNDECMAVIDELLGMISDHDGDTATGAHVIKRHLENCNCFVGLPCDCDQPWTPAP